MTPNEVLSTLAGRLPKAKWHGQGLRACCPAHEDDNPSFSIAIGTSGKLVWNCHAGCAQDDVQAAIERVLGQDPRRTGDQEDDAATKVYAVYDTGAKLIAEHVRTDLPGGGKKIAWRRPGGGWGLAGLSVQALPLYGAELLAKSNGAEVVLTEGEKAADAVRAMGRLGLGTVTGASTTPSSEVLACLRGRRVILWPDNDDPGEKHMAWIARSLRQLGIEHRVLRWAQAPPSGDAYDLLARSGGAQAAAEALEAMLKPQPPAWVMDLREAVKSTLAGLDRLSAGDFSDRVPTGIDRLDRALWGGLAPGKVYLVGAPSGYGKTALMGRIAFAALARGSVLFVSPEMAAEDLMIREIIRRSGAPMWQRTPWVRPELREWAVQKHAEAAAQIVRERQPGKDLYVVRTEALTDAITISDVESALDTLPGVRVLLIDYAQYIAEDEDNQRRRYRQVGEVAKRAGQLAKRRGVPCVIASQVNVAEDRGGKRVYSWRESQILEHEADCAMVLDVEWTRPEPGENGEPELRKVKSAAILTTKHRGGSMFHVPVQYRPALFELADTTRRAE